MNEALLSSKNMNWCTPQDFFDKLNEEFSFTLDAAATDKSAKCEKYYTPETDGLKSPWNCGGLYFAIRRTAAVLVFGWKKHTTKQKNGTTIVLLIPSRTDTSYFHDYIYGKAEIRFVRGRLTFTDEDGKPQLNASGKPAPAPFPSMVVVYNGGKYEIT